MNLILKYKLRSINYNYISKSNCTNIKELPNSLSKGILLIKNFMINSSYEFLIILFLLKLIGNTKPSILKSKKDILINGIRKNDSLSGYSTIRNTKLNNYYLKFIKNYLKVIDLKRQFQYESSSDNTFQLRILNINKIDKDIFNENKLIRNYTLELTLNQKKNRDSNFKYSNNIKLLLSHFNYPFINN